MTDNYNKFLQEQKVIQNYKKSHPEHIFAFTKKENKLLLVAHANTNKELQKLILEKRKENIISKEDKIFYQ